jgi:hypothetical protein
MQTDITFHTVFCDFGRRGQATTESDPACCSEADVVAALVSGQYDGPLAVFAFHPCEGWARDVSEDVAETVVALARELREDLTPSVKAFCERHLDLPHGIEWALAHEAIGRAA